MTDSGKQSLVIVPLSNGESAEMENGMSEAALTESSGQQEPKLLDACEDKYDGVTVELGNVPLDVDGFVSSLTVSLSKWAQQGKKGVWIKVPKNHANLVPAVIDEGFWYHHAERDYVMLVYWIPKSPCTLPANASHQVGVGGFVMNDNRELLVVQEKDGPYRGSGIWKWPTGLLHQGEDIFEGAIREVKEETGIDTEFVEVGGIRHSHDAPFEKSDIFFMCILRPLSFDIKMQESEIAAARWMPIEEFARQPRYQANELYKKILDVCIATFEKRCKGFCAVKLASSSAKRPSVFYYNDQEVNDANSLNGAVR
uniref:TSA: Wollemia nobilis Ref_Wollemi_Transcript_12540_1464 transcribed RNA sequence n=1 Tax=Wollemia nobilis TaxID=56998 RepID=A0A0C9S7Z6_9CONI